MTLQQFGIRSFLMIGMVWGCMACSRERPADPTTLDWHPDLDQPIRQLEEVLAATQQQQPMNYTSANLAFVLDAKLYLLFERYIGSLPADQRALAMDEQRLWLQQRIQAVDKAYAPYEGGTFASYAANEAFIDFTKQRIAVLERRLGSATTMP